ncbi:uncharacterized protein LOC128989533 [Macrosteles quadrilineatus]|uniref:uncharacterized protein LOC128989533 n=1 Tax=Macrosteles quadrilineatus TaxID=74068 RepID=UPI0023E2DC69|nr:uncharacterized protein LOC128989533 [Macrosteles quadrilineatus]
MQQVINVCAAYQVAQYGNMWVLLVTASLVLGGDSAPPPALLELGETVSEILSDLEDIPLEERVDDTVPPELLELYQNIEMLLEIQKSNLTESREGRGLLSKLSFLTGLKLGNFLTSSGTLAASQSINFLGKVLNAALSVSYGNVGGYPGLGGENGIGVGELGALGAPIVGLQKLPVIEEDVPDEDKKREKPDNASLPVTSPVSTPAVRIRASPVESSRKEFLKDHNHRVDNFNNNFEKKLRSRTGRIEAST